MRSESEQNVGEKIQQCLSLVMFLSDTKINRLQEDLGIVYHILRGEGHNRTGHI